MSKLGLGRGAVSVPFRTSAGGAGGGSGSASRAFGLGGSGASGVGNGSRGGRRKGSVNKKSSSQSTIQTNSYTRTNNQVASIDEADIIKSNGKALFHASGRDLFVTSTWPVTAMKKESSVNFNNRIQDILLYGKSYVVVFTHHSPKQQTPKETYRINSKRRIKKTMGPKTEVIVFDMTDIKKPRQMAQYIVEGSYKQARLKGSELLVFTSSNVSTPRVGYKYGLGRRKSSINTKKPDLIKGYSLTDLLGKYTENKTTCRNIIYRGDETSLALTRINKISLIDTKIRSEVIMLMSSNEQYISENNIYLHEYQSSIQPSRRFRRWSQSSVFHKFNYKSGFKYQGSASTTGRILNQFSMDEYNGSLRVALTDRTNRVSANKVVIFSNQKNRFVKTGSIENIAKGEEIKSARFDGPKGYLVTFRRIDPLFALDLSNPSKPKITGELKIPGFSTYIHPIGNDKLLTIGYSADPKTGRRQGLKLSTFDVSNPKKLVEIDTIVSGMRTRSKATTDHHAFNFYDKHQVLAFPSTNHSWGNGSGIDLFKIEKNYKIKELGSLAYAQHFSKSSGYRRAPERSLFSENYIYGIGPLGIIAADWSKPENIVKSVAYPEGEIISEQKNWKSVGITSPFSSRSFSARSTGRASVDFKLVHSEKGGLTIQEIMAPTRANLNQIRHCYEQLLQRSPAVSGKVKAKFVVALSGRVASSNIVSSSISDSSLQRCIVGKIKRWKFPRPRGGQPVPATVAFELKATKG